MPFLSIIRPAVPIRGDGSPADANVVRGLTGLSPLAQSIESLGLNYEFGLFQREIGIETLGLLRFKGLLYVDGKQRAKLSRFRG